MHTYIHTYIYIDIWKYIHTCIDIYICVSGRDRNKIGYGFGLWILMDDGWWLYDCDDSVCISVGLVTAVQRRMFVMMFILYVDY